MKLDITASETPGRTLADRLKIELETGLLDNETRLSLTGEFGELLIELAEVDSMSCRIEQFSLLTDRLQGLKANQLRALCDDLVARCSYLLEPICVIEIDGLAQEAQLRSSPPAKHAEATEYFELTVRATPTLCEALTLKRYAKKPGQARAAIPACVTHEVLLRLANDFIEAAKNQFAPV